MSHNNDYYHGTDGGQIMSANNFNDGVISLLRTESAFVSKILQRKNYDTLLEIGCDLARNYEIARMHNIAYIGMDTRKAVIDALINNAARSTRYQNAVFINDDALNLDRIRAQLTRRPTLCLLPFNLLGNLTSPGALFSVCARAAMDVVVSSWQCSSDASTVRANYYAKCGIDHLYFVETELSHCFIRADFRSIAYRHHYLRQLADHNGYVLNEMFETNLGQLQYFCRQES